MTPGDQAIRPCPHCDDGILWRNNDTSELTCDLCFVSFAPSITPTPAQKQRERREKRQSRRPHEEYDNDTTRLIGGYERAFYSWRTGPEYAIDAYGDHTEGLLVPHKRTWNRAADA